MERGKPSTSIFNTDAAHKEKVRKLMDDADYSLNLLASLGDEGDDEKRRYDVNTSVPNMMMNTTSLPSFLMEVTSNQEEEEDRPVETSIRKGFLHVKGIFPDKSVEYVDLDPRFTTVGEMKYKFCERRDTRQQLGFDAENATVMFDGQAVEDDWLVLDCGMSFGGVVHIVKKSNFYLKSTSQLFKKSSLGPNHLPISSISSAYPKFVTSFDGVEREEEGDAISGELSSFQDSLVLTSTSQIPLLQAESLSRNIRPEESNFANMVSDFYENVEKVEDSNLFCEKLLKGYIDILQTRLENIENQLNISKQASISYRTSGSQRLEDEIKQLRDERNTWRLLYELRQICHEEDGLGENEDTLMASTNNSIDDLPLNFEMIEDDALKLLETTNETFKIQVAVKKWLENMAMENTSKISDKRAASAYSSVARSVKAWRKKTRGDPKHGTSPTCCADPDAIFRYGDANVLPDEAEDEAELLKNVWLFIRAGQLQEAVDLCIRFGQSWRAASISGGNPVGVCEDESLERWGNPYRVVWKTMCWKFAEKKPSLTKPESKLARSYEEIVYAGLSGHVDILTGSSLCETWEDHCWAYLNALVELQRDQVLYKLLTQKSQSSALIVGYQPHHLRLFAEILDKNKSLKRYLSNLGSLFDELATSKVEKVKQQANQPHQQIQAKLATAQIEYIVSNILDTLILSNEASENQSANNQFDWDLRLNEKTPADKISAQFLRFAAHFVLFCSSTGEKQDEQAAQMILKAYIRHLIKHSQLKLVPIYVSRLPEKAAVSVFCQFLSTIERSSTDRELALKLILQYADEQILTQVAQQTVEQLLLSLKETQVQVDASNKHTISVLDHKRMKSLEFLCVYDRHRSIALAQANRLAKEFVLEGKFEAVRELFVDILPEDSLDMINLQREELTNEWIDRCLREYLSWKAFICAFDVYQVWRECVSTGATLTRATYNEEKDFMTELCYHASAAGSALVDILHFENGWMQLCASSEEDDTKVYAAIRRKCLPQLVFHLHYVQLETAKIVMRLKFYPQDAKIQVAKPLLEKSMQVADIVADEHYGVYKALDEHQCRDLLDKIRESAIALLFVQEQQPQEETFEPQQRRTSASSSNSTLRSLRTS